MTEVDQLDQDLLRLVVRVVSAYVANNATAAEALPEIIRSVHAAFRPVCEDLKLMPAANRKPVVAGQVSLFCGVNVRGLQNGRKPQSLKRARSTLYEKRPDLDLMSSTLANATDLSKPPVAPGGSSFPDVQRIPEGVSGMRRGRNTGFAG